MTILPQIRGRVGPSIVRFKRIALFSALFVCLCTSFAFAAEAQQRSYDIPAGEATVTLKQFSDQSGEQIFFLVNNVRGVQTNAVSGELYANEALNRMLSGTDLIASRDESTGAFSVTRKEARVKSKAAEQLVPTANDAQAEQPVVLSPFEVNESSNSGYGVTATSSASRVAQNYIDVPQTVNVVTSQYINDFNIQDQRTLLEYVPNIVESQSQYLEMRGIPLGAAYIDGVVATSTPTVMPIQFYDRVEIVKGPSSAAFGLGEPAGIINYVSKTPTGVDKTTFNVGIGDYQNYFFNIDTQGRDAKFKNITYRAVVFGQEGYQEVHSQGQHRGMGALLTVRDDINQTTSMQLIVNYSKTVGMVTTDVTEFFKNQTAENFLTILGLPALPHIIGKNADLTPRGWGNAQTDMWFRANFIFDKSFADNHVHLRNTAVYENDPTEEFWGSVDNIFNPRPGIYTTGVDRYHQRTTTNAMSDNLDADSSVHFRGIDFRTLAGANIRQSYSWQAADGPPDLNADGTQAVVNIYNPDLTPFFYPTSPITAANGTVTQPELHYWNNSQRNYTAGFYAQEEASLFRNMVTLLAGWRIDYFHNFSITGLNGTHTSPGWQNTKGAPRFAVTVKPTKWLSAYWLYTEHKDPVQYTQKYILVQRGTISQATIDKYDNFQDQLAYQPNGKCYEAGVKANLFDGKLTLSACVFHELVGNSIQPSTFIITNSDGSITQIATQYESSENVKGYELEIFGQPTPRLSFIADYGISRGTLAASTPTTPLWVDPPTTVSFHGKYDFGDLHGDGIYTTFGAIYWSPYWLSAGPPYVWYSSGQYSFDAGIGYKWRHGQQSINLQVSNFTDSQDLLGTIAQYNQAPREQAFVTYTLSF